MDSTLYAGMFDSEAYWRDGSYSKIPAIQDKARNNIVMAMDELMFPFCNQNDLLLTKYPMEDAHKSYLKSIGFSFEHITSGDVRGGVDFFQALATGLEHKEYSLPFKRFSPYSILPYTHQILERYGFSNELPLYDVVKRVNSKLYSSSLSKQLFKEDYSQAVYSADELKGVCTSILGDHGSVILKDPFGVSGKGNMLIHSSGTLERIVSYIRKQEQQGASTAFIVEPFQDVAHDFSCQFEITKEGLFQLISMQEIINKQFAYLGSRTMDEERKRWLEKLGYFETMEKAASNLYREGYFGPVCVDSMYLKNGILVPIVEINARKSMGLINHYLDETLSRCGKRGFLTYLSVGYRDRFEYESWLIKLKQRELLFPNNRGDGILPLSSGTLFVNFDLNKECDPMQHESVNLYKGRLYMTIIAGDSAERGQLIEGLQTTFTEQGVKCYK